MLVQSLKNLRGILVLAPTWEVGEPFPSQAEQGLDVAITVPREGTSSSFPLKDLVPADLEIMHLG